MAAPNLMSDAEVFGTATSTPPTNPAGFGLYPDPAVDPRVVATKGMPQPAAAPAPAQAPTLLTDDQVFGKADQPKLLSDDEVFGPKETTPLPQAIPHATFDAAGNPVSVEIQDGQGKTISPPVATKAQEEADANKAIEEDLSGKGAADVGGGLGDTQAGAAASFSKIAQERYAPILKSGTVNAIADVARPVMLAAGTLGVIADHVASLVTQKPTTAVQDAIFKYGAASNDAWAEKYAAQVPKDQAIDQRIVGDVPGIVSTVLQAAGTGGEAPAEETALKLPEYTQKTSDFVRQAFAKGFRGMSAPAMEAGVNTVDKNVKQGVDLNAAVQQGIASAVQTEMMGVIPLNGPGGQGAVAAVKRMATGAVTMPAFTELGRRISNAIYGAQYADKQQGYDPAETISSAIEGAGFGLLPHDQTQGAADLRSPEEQAQSKAQAIRDQVDTLNKERAAQAKTTSDNLAPEHKDLLNRSLADVEQKIPQATGAELTELQQRREALKEALGAESTDNGSETQAEPDQAAMDAKDEAMRATLTKPTKLMTPEEKDAALDTDHLTLLPNRRAFEAKEQEQPAGAYSAIDLVGFKNINDTVGHDAGDQILKSWGQVLRQSGVDAARTGGDEFTVRGESQEQLEKAMADLKARVATKQFNFQTPDGKPVTVGLDFRYGIGDTARKADEAQVRTRSAGQQAGAPGAGDVSGAGEPAAGEQVPGGEQQEGAEPAQGEAEPALTPAEEAASAAANEKKLKASQAAKARALKAQNQPVDPTSDHLLAAIAKSGGLNADEAKSVYGFDPADMRMAFGHGLKRVFTKNGMPADKMAELMHEHGYPVQDEKGNYDPRVLMEHVEDSLRGKKVYSTHAADMVAQSAAEAHEQALKDAEADRAANSGPQDYGFGSGHDYPAQEYGADWTPSERVAHDMAAKAREADPDLAEAVIEKWGKDAITTTEAVKEFEAIINARSESHGQETQVPGETGSLRETGSEGADHREGDEPTASQREAPRDFALAQESAPTAGGPRRATQQDMLGGATETQQALHRERLKRDEARNSGQESAETGDAGDMFSKAKDQNGLKFRLKEGEDDKAAPRLSVLHNLSPENLKHADELGGLAVPSLGVVKEGMGLHGFGDITLIGGKHLADPSQEPVFDSDAWSHTHPRAEFGKVKTPEAQKFFDKLKPLLEKYDGRTWSNLWDHMVNKPNPDDALHEAERTNGMKALYLKEKGVKLPEPHVIEERETQIAGEPAWTHFMETADHAADDLGYDDPRRKAYEKERAAAAMKALKQWAKRTGEEPITGLPQTHRPEFRRSGEIHPSLHWKMQQDYHNAKKGAVKVETYKTRDRLDAAIKKAGGKEEFDLWVRKTLLPMFGKPFIRVGGKKMDYTLSSLVHAMRSTNVRAQQEHMTFGGGKARAATAHRFTDLNEMRNFAGRQMKDENTVRAAIEASDKVMDAYRDSVLPYYKPAYAEGRQGDTWEALDGSMKAMAKWAKGARTVEGLRRALASEDFRGVPEDVLEQGVEAGKQFMEVPSAYFEAKPQRAVKLSEFAGALIPKGAPDFVRDILNKHGVPFRVFDSSPHKTNEAIHAARDRATDKFRQELARKDKDVLFSLRDSKTQDEKYRLAPAGREGQAKADAEKAIAPLRKQWGKDAPRIVVHQSESDLPGHHQDEIKAAGASGRVEGFYDPDTHTVHLIADNLKTPGDVVRTLLHEVRGHARLRDVFGRDIEPILNRVLNAYGKKGLQDIVDHYGLDWDNRDDRLTAAEEKIAKIAETGENPSLLQHVIAFIRGHLRKLFPDMKFSDAEIHQLVHDMNRGLDHPETARQMGEPAHAGARFSLRGPQAYKDFQKLKGTAVDRAHEAAKQKVSEGIHAIGDILEKHTPDPVHDFFGALHKKMGYVGNELDKSLKPLDAGNEDTAALAKRYANAEAETKLRVLDSMEKLQKDFTPEQRQRIWEATSAESVAKVTGIEAKGGFDTLSPKEREAAIQLQKDNDPIADEAVKLGILKHRYQIYDPRFLAGIAQDHGGSNVLNPMGHDIRLTTPHALAREHLTADESEKAAQALYGDKAHLIRDARILPFAGYQLQRIINAHKLIRAIDDYGQGRGERLVLSGDEAPGIEHKGYKSIDNPAFTYAGKQAGLFSSPKLWIHPDLEGPLRAVLTKSDHGILTRGALSLKSKAMATIVGAFPPIHRSTVFFKTAVTYPMSMFSGRLQAMGKDLRLSNSEEKYQAARDGLRDVSRRGWVGTVEDLDTEPRIDDKVGQSWTAQMLGAGARVAGMPAGKGKEWQQTVKEAVDDAGHFWHSTLMWEKVANTQYGLYRMVKADLVKRGMEEDGAGKVAAQVANRFVGAIAKEDMSEAARTVLNLSLFSRSFTMSNLGLYKDALGSGLPKAVVGQISAADKALANNFYRRKAAGALIKDIAALTVTNAALQSVIALWTKQETGDQIVDGYKKRFADYVTAGMQNPLHFLTGIGGISPTSKNEPGKEDYIYLGRNAQGTGMYLKNPFGKVGFDLLHWLTSPLQELNRKESTIAGPAIKVLSNDKGYGRQIYSPQDAWQDEVMDVAKYLINENTPSQLIHGAYDAVTGKDRSSTNLAQSALSPLGLFVSHGAPGGPPEGFMYAAEKQHDFDKQQALPDIRKAILNGDDATAVRGMLDAHMTAQEIRSTIENTLAPGKSLDKQRIMKVVQYMTPEQRQAFMDSFRQQ